MKPYVKNNFYIHDIMDKQTSLINKMVLRYNSLINEKEDIITEQQDIIHQQNILINKLLSDISQKENKVPVRQKLSNMFNFQTS